jgi:Apea-like HEPN
LPNGEITEELNNRSSQWGFQMFTFSNLSKELRIDDFIKPEINEVKIKPHTRYYLHEPLEKKDSEIYFPDSIDFAFDNYFTLLSQQSREIIDTVAYLICNGIEMTQKMKSMSFLSFVSSIETLVNYEYADKNSDIKFECSDCKTLISSPYKCKCGKPIWGIAFKFREFLKNFISNTEDSIKRYKRIYNFRSSIVHNGALLLGDNQFNWEKSDESKKHTLIYLETMQMSKLALMRWLILKNPNLEWIE